MIITKTPHRISFFGGGTDYPSWYLEHGGKVLGVSINKYCYLTVREFPPFFPNKHRIVYSLVENVSSIEEIKHPSVREVMKFLKFQNGISIHHDADIPARSGMGSSSAFTVGLLKAMYGLLGRTISKKDLFETAIHVEQDLIKETVGSQDQVFAACGGLNTIEFLSNGKIVVNPVIMTRESLLAFENKFMLFFTGISRTASEIADEQVKNTAKNRKELDTMKSLVDEGLKVITNNDKSDFKDFGRLLNETWKLKKALSSRITTGLIDDIYSAAMSNGAGGGKLLGAGGGGFILFYVEPENREKVKKALSKYLQIPFEFDFTGSDIIFYNPISKI